MFLTLSIIAVIRKTTILRIVSGKRVAAILVTSMSIVACLKANIKIQTPEAKQQIFFI